MAPEMRRTGINMGEDSYGECKTDILRKCKDLIQDREVEEVFEKSNRNLWTEKYTKKI
jgi:hypothetical protein